MRASRKGAHISGAERIVDAADAPSAASLLAARALSHPLGPPDSVNVKIEDAGEISRVKALPVVSHEVASAAEGLALAVKLLEGAGVARAREMMEMFPATHSMRGAMLVDAATLERLEPDRERGVRATRMDSDAPFAASCAAGKNHFAEAVVLASKVASAPGIAGEICISDDPGYVTGYVAAPAIGYCRISVMKESGDPRGGRIFIYSGPRDAVSATIRYLEEKTVVVEGAPLSPAARKRPSPEEAVEAELRRIDAAGLSRKCVESESDFETVFSSNDYLRISQNPEVVRAAEEALRRWGAGSGGSRLLSGTRRPHVSLERRIASFKGSEAAVLYATGYMANVGVMSAVAGKSDTVFSDELNHASIIDGCRLSGAKIVVYRHSDMEDLEEKISAFKDSPGRLVAVSDGVFSMDGDILDLPRFLSVCRKAGAFSIVDEAHATGVVGRTGRGLCEHFCSPAPDIVVGTLSKALGVEGGFACCSRRMAEYLVNKSRPFIFSTAPCAAVAAAAEAAISVLEAHPELVERLRENTAFFVSELAKGGIAAKTDSAIVPIRIGDERRALAAAEALRERGFSIPAVRYPTVPKGEARLRVAVSAAHSRERLAAAAAAICEICAAIPPA